MLVTNTDPENRKNEPCIKAIERIIPKMFQIVPHVLTDLC